jgi:hypothetical protein
MRWARRLIGRGVIALVTAAFWAAAASALTATPTRTPSPAGWPCVGDCDASGDVEVSEVIRCVGVATRSSGGTCADCDDNLDGEVAVNELIAAVNALLGGCLLGDRYEPDDSLTAASAIACGELQAHDLGVTGDQDWVAFELPAGQGGVIETVSVGQGFWDTNLSLYTAAGSSLAYDDDSGEGAFSRIEFGCAASPGTSAYAARAGQYFGAALGGYGIRLTCRTCPTPTRTASPTPTIAPDAFEPDDNVEQASAITCGAVQRHTAPYGDVDWVSLTLDSRSTVHPRFTYRAGYAVMTIFDAQGRQVTNPYFDGFECGRNALPAGRYDIRVNGDFYAGTEYDLGVLCAPCDLDDPTPTATFSPTPTATPIPPDAYEIDDRESAVPISCGEGLIRSLSSREDSDWLMLSVPERSAVTIQTLSPFSTPQLALQDAEGRDIGYGYGVIDRICGESALDAGTYFVEAYHGDFAFPYDVWVSCDPCPGEGRATPSMATRTPTPTALMPDAYEPDDSAEQARPIACGGLQVHSIDARYDEDWVAFEVADPSAISASASAELPLELYAGESGQLVANGYRFLDRTCGAAALPPGAYRLVVRGSYYPIPAYNLSLLCQACPATPTPTPSRPPTATRTPRPTRTPGGTGDGFRVFSVEPGTLLADAAGTGSGLFTTGLSGANASNGPSDGFSGGPLTLLVGLPDANGVAPLHLLEDVVLRAGILDGSYLCLHLGADGSEGSIDCDGGTAYGVVGYQPPGNVGAPFTISTGVGPPLGAGHANLLLPVRYQIVEVSSPDFGRPCDRITYHDPEQLYAFTTGAAVAEKGSLLLSVSGQPFDCVDIGSPCSGGQLAAPVPGSQPPIGDVANVLRLAESCPAD